MASLKSFLPVLSRNLGLTPDALYSRQRALVNLGLLAAKEGRGPGSGVELSADTLAVLLIAIMSADTLADMDGRAVAMCNSIRESGARDPRFPTGQTLREAVAVVLMEDDPVTLSIRIARCWRGELTVMQRPWKGDVRRMNYYVPLDQRQHGEGWRPISAMTEMAEITLVMIRNDLRVALGLKSNRDERPVRDEIRAVIARARETSDVWPSSKPAAKRKTKTKGK
jgi:hypothetical protein